MNQPTAEDIAALRADGDLASYLLALTGRTPAPEPTPSATTSDPAYRITHTGGWPIGTTATGPTPTHGRCACAKCDKAAVVELPQRDDRQEGEAA